MFKRTNKSSDDLTAFERELLKSIFPGSKRTKKLSDLRNKFYANLPDLEKELYKEMVRRDFFKRRPDQVRTSWKSVGIFMIVTSGVVWLILNGLMGLRVSEEEEMDGLDKGEIGVEAYPEFTKV